MTLARYNRVVQDADGNGVGGAHIEVRTEVAGQPLSALYSDRNGTVGIGNPFDAASDGSFYFHAASGEYQVRAYTGASGAPTFEKILRYEQVGPPSVQNSLGVETPITASPYGVGSVETFLTIKRAAPTLTVINLPPVADRDAVPFAYVDWSTGIVSDHEIRFVADGSETVMKAATYSVWSNASGLARGWVYPAQDLSGWVVT
jgi:hypothetical protein